MSKFWIFVLMIAILFGIGINTINTSAKSNQLGEYITTMSENNYLEDSVMVIRAHNLQASNLYSILVNDELFLNWTTEINPPPYYDFFTTVKTKDGDFMEIHLCNEYSEVIDTRTVIVMSYDEFIDTNFLVDATVSLLIGAIFIGILLVIVNASRGTLSTVSSSYSRSITYNSDIEDIEVISEKSLGESEVLESTTTIVIDDQELTLDELEEQMISQFDSWQHGGKK